MNARTATAAAFAATVLAAMVSFILTTVAMDTLPDAVLVGTSTVVAFAIVVSTGGWRVAGRLGQLDRRAVVLAAAGGALAFWATPLLALSQRATSAPSGADTLFLTTTLWCVLVVLGAYLVAGERPAVTGIAGAICSAAGAAGLLASWEYPSSFSPFARFAVREALMLVAGVLFAAGAIALAQAARRLKTGDVVTLALGGAAVLGLLASAPGVVAALAGPGTGWKPAVYLGVASAGFAFCWIWLTARVGVARTAASLLLVAPAMTALSAYEAATAVYGQRPFEMRGVLTGSAIVMAGAAVLWLAVPDRTSTRAIDRRTAQVAMWVGVAACVGALVSLATPALTALAEGHITETFRAEWTMLGFESAAGWMPVAASLLALTAAIAASRGAATRAWVSAAAAVLACALALPLLAATTLHTWNQWIPAAVQQTYGTEYARFSVSAILDPVRVGAMALSVVSAGVLGLAAVRGSRIDRLADAAQEEGSR